MPGLLKAAVVTGLIGGALDFAAASLVYPLAYPGLKIARIWQSVAEGVLGKAAYEGGAGTVLLGVGLHFFIALCAGIVLVLAMSRAEIFRRMWPVSGAVFGVAVYFFMQKIVLPLSLAGAAPASAKGLAIGLAIHVLVFGLPMAFVASRMLTRKSAS